MPSLRSCSRFKELGVFPDGLVYHRYAMNLKSQPPLNSVSLDWKEIGDHFRQEINDYIGQDHGDKLDLLCTESNYGEGNGPLPGANNLIGGLYLIDCYANALQSEFHSLIWWQREGDALHIEADPTPRFGWRSGYSTFNLMTGPKDNINGVKSRMYLANQKFPSYSGFKLLQWFARANDTVVTATSSRPADVAVYACKHSDGVLALLLINKDARLPAHDVDVTLDNFVPRSDGTIASYGSAQDANACANSQDQGTRNEDVSQAPLANLAGTFHVTVPTLTAEVIQISPAK